MQIHFLRHATLIVSLKGIQLLVDPMLSPADAMDPIQNSANQRRNPLVDLPFSDIELSDVLAQVSGVLVTHTHRDHWDATAVERLSKELPILCQPEDETKFRDAGFSTVLPIHTERTWHAIRLQRTSGQHGTGVIGQKMAPVSGFVLSAEGEPTLYTAGDTIWCSEVSSALETYTPDVVVVNAGAAAFLTGDPITMTAEDVAQVCRALPTARVLAVHMEAINHCGLTRAALRQHLAQVGLLEAPLHRMLIPSDGTLLTF
jgi:L-ascorbate metabolism protein UlaG (beta-lactamase superfamily)